MTTRLGRKTIDDIQQFAREHELPVPDGYLSSGEGGVHLGRDVQVVEVKATVDPIRITKIERGYRGGGDSQTIRQHQVKARGGGFLTRIFAGGRTFFRR